MKDIERYKKYSEELKSVTIWFYEFQIENKLKLSVAALRYSFNKKLIAMYRPVVITQSFLQSFFS